MRRMPTKKEIAKIAESAGLTPEVLLENLTGDIGISVDLAEDEKSVVASLDLTGGSAGKVLAVNEAGTGVEWKEISIPESKKIYIHTINISKFTSISTNFSISINKYSTDATPITALADIVTLGQYLPAFGTYTNSDVNYTCINAVRIPSGLSVKAIKDSDGVINTFTVTEGTITDNVAEI